MITRTSVSAFAERHETARRYILAVLLVCVGMLIRLPFTSELGTSVPFITFFPMVILSAWWGGLGPSLVAIVLSAGAGLYFVSEPVSSFGFQVAGPLLRLIFFLGCGILISLVAHILQKARKHALDQAVIARERLDLLMREQADRKRAELAEERQRRLSTQTLAGIGDGVIATDERSRITFMNPVAEQLTGWSFVDAKDSPLAQVFRIISEETGEGVPSPVGKVLREGVVAGLANRTVLVARDGHHIPIEDSGAPIHDQDQNVIGAVLVFRNVAERRAAQQALAASEKQLTEILESITDGLVVVDSEYRLTYVNTAAEQLLGRKREELLGKKVWEEYPALRGTIAEQAYTQAMNERVPVTFEDLYLPWNRWFDARVYPHRAGGISIYFRDITKRKRHTELVEGIVRRLDESSALIDTVFEEAPVGVGLWDTELRCVRVNRALAEMNGLPREAHLGKTMAELFPQLDPTIMDSIRHVIATGSPILNREERRRIELTGKERFWSSSYYPVRVRDEIIGVGTICEEITERREAEQLLRESEAQFRQMADGLPQLVWTALPNGFNDYFNRRWYEYTGFSLDESQGVGWKQILHPEDRESTLGSWQRSLDTGNPYENEHRFRRSDGVYRWFLGRAVPIFNEDQTIIRWFGTCTDIDDQKRNQEALRQANSDLEQFAYSASHDLQEPLRNVTAFSQLLKRQYAHKLDGDADLYITYIVNGAKRMESLIRALLSYTQVTGSTEQVKHTVDANSVLSKALTNLSATIAQNRAVVTSDCLPPVLLEEMHLLQLFQNLISNAIKYRREEDPCIHVSARSERGWKIFSVRDNGIGIEPQFTDRIFGIFRRLHSGDKYEGTGIGLAICQKIVERHGGRIWVESEVGKGSVFQFSLPGGEEA